MWVTVRKASRRLGGMNPHFVKGRAEGMGILLERVGNALVMTEADFARLSEHLKQDGYKVPEPEAAAAS